MISFLLGVAIAWPFVGFLGWFSTRNSNPFEKRPFNWRVLVFPTLYFRWLDKRDRVQP